MDTIVPFMPLKHSDLVEIMRRKVFSLSQEYANKNWKRLVVSETMLRYIVGTDFIEYLDLQKQLNGEKNSFLVFSKYGAHMLENGGPMHVIRANIRLHLQPFRKNEVAFFDLDKETKSGIMKWCMNSENIFATDCEVVWTGPLE